MKEEFGVILRRCLVYSMISGPVKAGFVVIYKLCESQFFTDRFQKI